MRIIYYNTADPGGAGIAAFQQRLPEAQIRLWHPGDESPADYALVWKPPLAMLAGRPELKAICNLGAGVDAILPLLAQLPAHVPVYRLEDAGMGEQMADYVSLAVLGYFRRMDEYRQLATQACWQPKPARNKSAFPVTILGLGVLGQAIAQRLLLLGFPVSGWSRSAKQFSEQIRGVNCYHGQDQLSAALAEAKVLVSILPLTEQTRAIINRQTLMHMPAGGYLINVGRGAHVVEADLLQLLANGHLAGATLDVVQTEPLPPSHALWQNNKITITPHISALTLAQESEIQFAEKIRRLEQGLPVTGMIDRSRGY